MTFVSIDRALRSQALLGAALGDAASWRVWIAVLRAAFGLPLDVVQAKLFDDLAGGRVLPERRVREAWFIIGRRSGKSRIAAAVATYLASFVDHAGKLAPGETGFVLVLAASKAQARTVFDYIVGFYQSSPILMQQVEEITAEEIRLKGSIVIGVHTNNFRTVRGRTLLACVFDEAAFWRDELSSMPDVETYRAVLPALATTSGMLIGISSPYAQRGLLFNKHRDAYGKNDADVLVVQGTSQQFNPTLDTSVIEAARRDDPEAAQSEWDGVFRGDLSSYVDRAVVERCVEVGVRERPYQQRYRYCAFVDPSGGSHDSMTLAISHREGERAILDATREVRAPFSPLDVADEFCRLLASYRVTTVRGDNYSGETVKAAFRRNGVNYLPSDRSRSEIYLDALPLLNAGTAVLLDDPRLVSQISQLERRVTRGGRDSIDHMRGAMDDLANAVAGALVHVPSHGEMPAWLRQDMASGRESYAAPDADPLDYWDVKPPQPKVRTRRANEWRWKDPGTQRWDTVEADADPLADF